MEGVNKEEENKQSNMLREGVICCRVGGSFIIGKEGLREAKRGFGKGRRPRTPRHAREAVSVPSDEPLFTFREARRSCLFGKEGFSGRGCYRTIAFYRYSIKKRWEGMVREAVREGSSSGSSKFLLRWPDAATSADQDCVRGG